MLRTLLLAAFLAAPPDGRQIIRAMHDRYATTWYHTLGFVQRNTATHPDGTREHFVWREYAALPGRLRIEFTPADSGNGLLFVHDSEFVFHADTIASAAPFIHPLMVLGFDVYTDSVERTAARLERLGFDLATVREDTWQGRPVYVVGAPRRQFWVDRERLLFVRLLEPGQRDTARTSDVRFNKYQRAGGAWVSAEVDSSWMGRSAGSRSTPKSARATCCRRRCSTPGGGRRRGADTSFSRAPWRCSGLSLRNGPW